MNCWRCGTAIEISERVGFRDCCPKCDRPLHVCRSCDFYDPAYHNQCRETMAELVADKEHPNFCEYFTPRTSGSPAKPPLTGARGKLEELFKKKR